MGVVEDIRKVMQDFLAPELRSITVRLEGLQKQLDAFEKQRAEDRADLLKQRAEDRADLLKQRAEDRADLLKQREDDKADLLKQREDDKADLLKQRAEDKADLLRAISESTSSMQKRFELVIDYTKVLQRIDRIEESQQSKEH